MLIYYGKYLIFCSLVHHLFLSCKVSYSASNDLVRSFFYVDGTSAYVVDVEAFTTLDVIATATSTTVWFPLTCHTLYT